MNRYLHALIQEPPFRLLSKVIIRNFPFSIRFKAEWDAVTRPQYLAGILAGADQARREGVGKIYVIEFGVAGGAGLVQLEHLAQEVERETGVEISVVGFDTGAGMPAPIGDYRDHPDLWLPGDFVMNAAALRARLRPTTSLILGNIEDTVYHFVRSSEVPIGFIAIDVDFYSSARSALKILQTSQHLLCRTPLYFDDTRLSGCHRFGGELLAIEEFNAENRSIKIDEWRGLADGRPFPEAEWLKQMYFAHNFAAINELHISRRPVVLALD